MSVELSQFHQVFIEESFEGLDLMESALMEFDINDVDLEVINTIFRSAHSIKGGSATFGFTDVAEFTHVLETLLDQARAGQRKLSADDINLLLKSVDCMRDMMSLIQDDQPGTTPQSEELKKQFESLLGQEHSNNEQQDKPSETQASEVDNSIRVINLIPGRDILKSGNDIGRIFRALADLGEVSVCPELNAVPKLSELDPEDLHTQWLISFDGKATDEEVLEVFEWISDESEISIERKERPKRFGISFKPVKDIFHSGNDPLKILTQLREEAEHISVQANVGEVPSLKLLDPEESFLTWDIELEGAQSQEDVSAVFEWVEDHAEIAIKDLNPQPEVAQASVQESAGNSKVAEANDSAQALAATQQATQQAAKAKKPANAEASSIRVGIDKIDNLINMVGELVITQSMLGQLGNAFDQTKTPKLIEGLSQLEQNTRELQESVMRIRMLPISFAFSRFPRMVRDLSQQLGKQINLEMQGEQTELDKTVMEKIGDPLVHLVRNAIDHGIESPDKRQASGKKAAGHIILNAYHQGGNVVIEITDDGKGLDREAILNKAIDRGLVQDKDAALMPDDQVYDLIFQPGFSTAQTVSDVSGRGVGMDVVRKNIQALNGVVEIHSKKGEGSTIRIRLPLTLAILDGQLVRVGDNTYIIPLVSIVESMQCKSDLVSNIAGGCSVFQLRDDYVPIVRLSQVFNVKPEFTDLEQALLVVVEADGEKIGIIVDELQAQQQVVIKSLEQNYKRVEGVSGATILGDGTVALIIDIPGVVKLAGEDDFNQVTAQNVIHKRHPVQELRKLA